MKRFMFFPCALVTVFCISAEILTPDRMTVWDPGVPGGISVPSENIINVIDFGADSTGKADCKDAITRAIEAVPSEGGVVYFPAGSYYFSGTISIGKNNVVIRGDGYDKTKLLHDHTGLCFDVVAYKRGQWQNLPGGFTKGSKTVTVDDGSKFTVGAFAEIQQANDPPLMYTDQAWIQSWADNAVGQLFEVVNIEGNNVTFRTPLHYDVRSDLNPQIRPQGFVRGVGFENFYIERLQEGNSTFQFKNAAYCWVRNIESYHTRKMHITNNTTIGCEFRDSYFHRSFSYGDGGAGYGVEFGFHSTDGLCENNIFDSLRHAMMVHIGTVGCVFGYNYSINPVQGEGETNLNTGWDPCDISLHGHYAQMNLFEGNVVQEIGIADYWGPMGPGNTFLRNVVQGPGIYLSDNSHLQNLVGNTSKKWIDDGSSTGTIRHGEKVNGVYVWDESIENRVILVSYYLKNKPAFYGSMEWPSIGSDIENGKNPAQLRWESGKLITGIEKRIYKRPVTVPEKGGCLQKVFDLRGRMMVLPEAAFMSRPGISSGIYIYTDNSRKTTQFLR
ncbi:MAG: dockerin [Fibrobacter sp.]|nr:dockerin [Fibrobacter sp.]